MTAFTNFSDIPLFSYDLIMADPPWKFDNWSKAGEHKNASAKYECMDLEDIKRLPVGDLASPNCILWLWGTNPMLPDAIEVLKAWGFRYGTAGTWVKKTSRNNLAFGTGYLLRSASEPFLIGAIGKPLTAKNIRTVVEGPVREHSRKPDEAFTAAERMVPNARRLELFSRQERDGWDVFGNEIHKFSEA